METIEGNKLIAEFMQFDIEGNTQWYDDEDWGGLVPRKLERSGTVEDLLYHSSWDWLMPVVQKIEGKETDLGITVTIQEDICMIDRYLNSPYEKLISKYGGKTKIESTWLAIVEFIQWFNTTKPQPNATK